MNKKCIEKNLACAMILKFDFYTEYKNFNFDKFFL